MYTLNKGNSSIPLLEIYKSIEKKQIRGKHIKYKKKTTVWQKHNINM